MINGMPIPVIRDTMAKLIAEGKATLRDIRDEVEYVVENFNSIVLEEGFLETVMALTSMWDMTEYVHVLKNILEMFRSGEKPIAGSEVTIFFRQSGKRISLSKAYDARIGELAEPEPRNTPRGIVYVYELEVARAGRVGK